jgi:hypothetical protein
MQGLCRDPVGTLQEYTYYYTGYCLSLSTGTSSSLPNRPLTYPLPNMSPKSLESSTPAVSVSKLKYIDAGTISV